MVKSLRVFIILIVFLTSEMALSGFVEGVEAYKNKDYKKAQELFTPLVSEHPENPVLLYNLGLAEYQLGQMGMALGLWRKARYLDASYQPPQAAIDFLEEKMFPDQRNPSFIVAIYELLKSLPLWFWCSLCVLSFFLTGFFSLEYGVKKRLSLGLWPSWVFLLAPIFVFSSIFSTLVVLDSQRQMGTVVLKDLLTRTGPSPTSPTLSELQEGQLVRVGETHGEWVQIRSLTGAPGWVPLNSIIVFKGR